MLRRWYTSLGAAFLAVAALQAPFAHVHPEDPEHHHAQGFAHAHFDFDHHDSHEPEWEAHEDDESIVYLDWAPTAPPRIVIAYSEAPAVDAWVSVVVRLDPVAEFEPRSHSPPQVRLLPARSPPL